MRSIKLNESFYRIEGTQEELLPITEKLKVERPGARFDNRVKRGLISPYDHFYNVVDGALIVPAGLVEFLSGFGVYTEKLEPEFEIKDIKEYLSNISLPFKPYRHQMLAFFDSTQVYKQVNLMCTGSGKSLTISLLSDFLRTKGKKGLLVVPSINLLSQFKSDIKSYNLMDLYNSVHIIGGGQTIKNFDSPLTISTWQSLQDYKQDLHLIDYLIIDETHRATGDQLQEIILKSSNAKYKLGFTGTLNEEPRDRMALFSLFGKPKVYIKTYGLVELGLATPVHINAIQFKYNDMDKKLFRECKNYAQRLTFIKEHDNRNNFITKLAARIASDSGNTLILFQHTNHGKDLFLRAMEERHPGVEVSNADMVGKKSLDFQKQYGIYFINGEIKGSQREEIRQILEDEKDAIIIANYAVMSTGVNIKNLHNMIFASPLKSFTTITQAIGRGVRTHVSKSIFNVYDLADKFTDKGPFMKQYEKRKEMSYEPEGFPITEKEIYI